MIEAEAAQPKIPLAEVVACLSLATDLAAGLPLEHGLKRALLAVWIGELLGLDTEELSTAYYVALLGSLGCVLNVAGMAGFVKDEISFRGDMFTLDMSRPLPAVAFIAKRAGEGELPWRRLRKLLGLSLQSQAICHDVALQVGAMLDLAPAVNEALGQCEEHWDGRGTLLGLKGEEISLPARLFLLAQDIEVFNRTAGPDAAEAVVRERAGRYYDPRMAARFCEVAPRLLLRLQSVSVWDALIAAEPRPVRLLPAEEFDGMLGKMADVVDVRSVYTFGHSRQVAGLAEAAGKELGLTLHELTTTRHAGLVHDLGRLGVPVASWDKKGPLTSAEWERMQRHPSLTELMLARSPSLGPLGTLAGSHHERLDGSGYRGMTAASLPVTARLLAAADAYQTKLEARPHCPALSPEAAAEDLHRQAGQGRLDRDVVTALLDAAGQKIPLTKPQLPAGLSEREVEVLRLVVRGFSNREIGGKLFLSPKTAGHHIESIYAKIGVSTRVGATLFAVQHGMTRDG